MPRSTLSSVAARPDLAPSRVESAEPRREHSSPTPAIANPPLSWLEVRLALFDLDNTLLAGDSDLLWGELLARHGAMDVDRVRRFHDDYHAGTLDIEAFFEFQLAPLAREPLDRLESWREQFMEELVRPRIAPAARALVEHHRALDHELAIITATNRFLTTPIAREFGIEHLIATEPEVRDGRFTGRVHGVACYRTGKLVHLNHWLLTRGLTYGDLAETWFYSDSHNDLPLLSAVEHPAAVDPCPRLAVHASRNNWPILHLRAEPITHRWREADA